MLADSTSLTFLVVPSTDVVALTVHSLFVQVPADISALLRATFCLEGSERNPLQVPFKKFVLGTLVVAVRRVPDLSKYVASGAALVNENRDVNGAKTAGEPSAFL
jgi:hypothetical protein